MYSIPTFSISSPHQFRFYYLHLFYQYCSFKHINWRHTLHAFNPNA